MPRTLREPSLRLTCSRYGSRDEADLRREYRHFEHSYLPMMSEPAILKLRTLGRQAAYVEAVDYVNALPPAVRAQPPVALQIARMHLRQGDPISAEHALSAASLDSATDGERRVHEIEEVSLLIQRAGNMRDAVARADAVLARTRAQPVDSVMLLEVERVHVRIVLSAVTFFEVPRDVADAAFARLPYIADGLEQGGHVDEALAARLTYAERMPDAVQRVQALAGLVDIALRLDRPEVAAEAQTLRADCMLALQRPNDEVLSLLDAAAELYAQVGHRHGAVDVARVRARLSIDRELAGPEALESCLEAYQKIDFHRGVLTTLMDLSQLAHVRGDIPRALRYHSSALQLSERVGMGLSRDSLATAQVDLLMRAHRLADAIELCDAMMSGDIPRWSRGSYEQLLGTIFSFLNDASSACEHERRAISIFKSVGDLDSASTAALKLASDLASIRSDEGFSEAEALTREWMRHDDERAHVSDAIAKREMLVQIAILRFLYSPTLRGDARLLSDAVAFLDDADRKAGGLSPREAAQRRGNLAQMRAQVSQLHGDEAGVEHAWRMALASFESAGYAMEAANCRYMLGVLFLNRANAELLPNFGESEEQLRAALGYYETAGMRGQAADARFMVARLYTNAFARVSPDTGSAMLDAALEHLEQAETDLDAARREFDSTGSVLDRQRAKSAFVAKGQRIAELTMEILCRRRASPTEAWLRAQRSKARGLSDLLGMSEVPPARVLSRIEAFPDAMQQVADERELTAQLPRIGAEERLHVREELRRLRARMADDPRLAEYLELRNGAALDAADLATMIGDTRCVCVDWVTDGSQLFLLVIRPGQSPQLTALSLRLSDVASFVRSYLSKETFRVTLRDTPELLEALSPLVSPLRDYSEPDELLVLAPTGAMQALPLHALVVGGDALIARNPVVYVPSLTVLRHCLLRRTTGRQWQEAALFGDPAGNLPAAADLMSFLENRFATPAVVGRDVTMSAFRTAIRSRALVHFQGHAVHVPQEPLDSRLELADQNLTARDVFDLADLSADLVTLAACESASSTIAPGDEPIGLIPAFLYAGASSVLATLWKVNQASAAELMRRFYQQWTTDTAKDKASILQAAMLAVREVSGFESPYHWSPFVLYGSWY